MENLEHRFYGLVNYQLTGIQQGIQFGHAKDEYLIEILDLLIGGKEFQYRSLEESRNIANVFLKWLKEDKTYIILNGGTTNTNPERLGTLNKHALALKELGVMTASFYEPDLGDQLTAVVFIIDERVFNREKYPDMVWSQDLIRMKRDFGIEDMRFAKKLADEEKVWRKQFDTTDEEAIKIANIRIFLKPFRLA